MYKKNNIIGKWNNIKDNQFDDNDEMMMSDLMLMMVMVIKIVVRIE